MRCTPPSHSSRARGWAAILAVWLLLPAVARGQETLEAPLKASFLYRFGDFVEWPAGTFPAPDSPLNICVVGEDVFGKVLDDAVAGEQAAGRPLAVYRLDALDPGAACHIAYLAGSEAQSVEAALLTADRAPILTVTDEANGAARGAVHFEVVDDRVRFHVDEQAASRNGLAVSSRLLSIALTVNQPRAP